MPLETAENFSREIKEFQLICQGLSFLLKSLSETKISLVLYVFSNIHKRRQSVLTLQDLLAQLAKVETSELSSRSWSKLQILYSRSLCAKGKKTKLNTLSCKIDISTSLKLNWNASLCPNLQSGLPNQSWHCHLCSSYAEKLKSSSALLPMTLTWPQPHSSFA